MDYNPQQPLDIFQAYGFETLPLEFLRGDIAA